MAAEHSQIHKVVLTGGSCGGKTTGQARLSSFFEKLGWRVFRVPEAATVLLSGGITFSELTPEESLSFQENLLRTMISIEETFFELAKTCKRNCLVICDRGFMDASAYIDKERWESLKKKNGWNEVEMRDNRYNQVVHMITAADGAAEFYTTQDHPTRTEDPDEALVLDKKLRNAWIGHPNLEVIDNSTNFELKIRRMIECICSSLNIDTGELLLPTSRKLKFLVTGSLDEMQLTQYQDFKVVQHFLLTTSKDIQSYLQKRGQHGYWNYVLTTRRSNIHGQSVEIKTQLTERMYRNLLAQKDETRSLVSMKRRCFLVNTNYFQLDIFSDHCNQRCRGLMLLETYTSLKSEELQKNLPDFINVEREVTGDPDYFMVNMCLK